MCSRTRDVDTGKPHRINSGAVCFAPGTVRVTDRQDANRPDTNAALVVESDHAVEYGARGVLNALSEGGGAFPQRVECFDEVAVS